MKWKQAVHALIIDSISIKKEEEKGVGDVKKKSRIAPTITILEENFKNDMNPQWITFHMTHTLLYSMYYSGLCKSKMDVSAFKKKSLSDLAQLFLSPYVCMYVCVLYRSYSVAHATYRPEILWECFKLTGLVSFFSNF